MKVQILRTEYIDRLRTDPELKGKIAAINGGQVSTVDRWIKERHKLLTTATNLELMRSHWGLPATESLTIEDDVLA